MNSGVDEEYGTGAAWRGARHTRAAFVAVFLSLLLHATLLKWVPSLPLGRLGLARAPVRFKPVQMARVEPRPQPRQKLTAAVSFPIASASPPAPPIPGAAEFVPQKLSVPPREAGAIRPSDIAPDRVSARPLAYEEVLRVEEALYDESVAALPRKFDDDVTRQEGTPDVKLPGDLSAAWRAPQAERPPAPLPAAPSAGSVEPWSWSLVGGGEAREMHMAPQHELGVTEDVVSNQTKPLDEYLSLDVRVFRPSDEEAAYFELHIRPSREDMLPVLPRDVLLVQDVSESMTQRKVEICRRGWLHWLQTLSEQDRFDLLEFRDDVRACFGGWSRADAVNAARARTFIGEMASRGDTDIFRSLEAVLRRPAAEGRATLVILVSDGRATAGVMDSSAIIAKFSEKNAGDRSVFCVSGGARVNRFLLDVLSFANRGDHWMESMPGDMVVAMQRAAAELRRPVLAGLRFRATGTVSTNLYPVQPANLFLDRPLVLYGKTTPTETTFAVQIIGQSAQTTCDMMFPIDLAKAATGPVEIRTGWARQRIYALLQDFVKSRSAEVLARLQDVARRYEIPIPYDLEVL